jgi:methionine-S-sulfoxide reductase
MKLQITIKLLLLLIFITPAQARETTAIFAGGCFWCIEKDLEHVEGVIDVISGYTGGSAQQANYNQVSAGGTGHYEAVQVTYDSKVISYKQLLKEFWRSIDPHDPKGQFCDKGNQYRAAIFYKDDNERRLSEHSKRTLMDSGQLKETIVTGILKSSEFYPAEDYHQNYYKKNPIRYKFYRTRCGRDSRTEKVWEDINLKEILN